MRPLGGKEGGRLSREENICGRKILPRKKEKESKGTGKTTEPGTMKKYENNGGKKRKRKAWTRYLELED